MRDSGNIKIAENPIKTKHSKIYRSKDPFIQFEELNREINSLQILMKKNDFENIRAKLEKIIIDYSPNSGIIDHTFIKK